MDERNAIERWAWSVIGPPLYYCESCLRAVKVTVSEGAEPRIERKCAHTGNIIAPRRSILAGQGGLSLPNKLRMAYYTAAARATGRNV